MKHNWVCSNCGMWSNRKSSVKRHVMNLHNGNAFLVAFIDYVVVRQFCIYKSSTSSSPVGKTDLDYQKFGKKTPVDIFKEEFMREKARLVTRKDIGWNL